MKWIGQHIWDFISRFRSDVYLEATETGTIASGGNLGLDANNKIVKADTEAGELSFNGSTANGVLTYGGTSTIDVESTLTYASEILTVLSSTSEAPKINLMNTNTDAEAPMLQFFKTQTATDDDEIGEIIFNSNDDGGAAAINYATFKAYVADASNNDEAGKLEMKVATNSTEIQNAFTATGLGTGSRVDVDLGYGAASTTTIAGTLTMGTTAAITNAGQLSVAAQPNITTMTGFLGGTANAIITDDGDGTVTSESTLSYASAGGGGTTTMTMGQDHSGDSTIQKLAHSDGDGGPLKIIAGSATNGQTDKAGGDLQLHGGLGTGALNGGDIQFYSHKRGSSGTTIGTAALLSTFIAGSVNTDFIIYEDAGASTDDYYRVRVKANGETEIVTHDAAAMAAHYKVDADGDITFDPATGVVRAGWHGSTTRIKILHSDFIADDGGRPLQIDDTGVASENLFLETFSTFSAYVTIAIPSGYKATHVMIHGSGTGAVEVWEHQIDSKTGVSKGTGNVETEINITDVTSSSTNYLFIQVAAGSDEIHGGYVTIVAV
jgi:hypothetical protein